MGSLKCAKCGITSKEVPTLTFHRFPLPSSNNGSLKARVWAEYCFPESKWTFDESLKKLHTQRKMLCGNHFDNSSFTSTRKRLTKFAIPTDAQIILTKLRMQSNTSTEVQIKQEPEVSIKVETI